MGDARLILAGRFYAAKAKLLFVFAVKFNCSVDVVVAAYLTHPRLEQCLSKP